MLTLLLGVLLACTDKSSGDDSGQAQETGETGTTPAAVDDDEDGHASLATGGDDCDDANPAIHPGADEVCDEVDQDCDGEIDEGALDAGTWYADLDDDGYGDPDAPLSACTQPEASSSDATDCDDAEFMTHPGADEVCGDGQDNGCDGLAGECRETGEVNLGDTTGFTGDAAGDTLGMACLGAGDLDGDGAPDLAFGAPGSDEGGSRSGAVKVIYGPVDSDGGRAVATLYGEASGDEAGGALAAADLDGDGVRELIVGGAGGEGGAGVAWVVSSPADGPLLDADARLLGETSVDEAGAALSSAGDMSGAGADGLLIGAPSAGGGTGVVYLLTDVPSGTMDLGDSDIAWEGHSVGDSAGPVAGGADLDGDGSPDVAVGAAGQDDGGLGSGAVYVLTDVSKGGDLADAEAIWAGEAAGDAAGAALTMAGDVDGDGLGDLLIGGPDSDVGGDYSGMVWLVLGPATAGGSLADADARLTGGAIGDSAGSAVAGPGDVDGDGYDELFIGSPWAEGTTANAGNASLFYGPVSGTAAISDADLILYGEASLNRAGTSVGGAGDVNEDGAQDLLVGAPFLRTTGSDAGEVYVIFGEGI